MYNPLFFRKFIGTSDFFRKFIGNGITIRITLSITIKGKANLNNWLSFVKAMRIAQYMAQYMAQYNKANKQISC